MIQGYWQVSRRAWRHSIQAYEQKPDELRKFKRHLRWSVTAALREAASSDWFTFLETPGMRPFLEANPRLAFRPMGGYMSSRWAWRQRAAVIRDTYTFIQAQGGLLREAMGAPEGRILLRLALGRAAEATVWMGPHSQFRKEGEVSLFLHLAGVEGPLFGLAFSLSHQEGGWACYLGGLQGRKGGDEEQIKFATKAMHGLRPKAFMLFVAQELARSLRVRHLYGVGNGIHVFRSRRIGPPRKILFDFDGFWEEAEGKLQEDGWFRLPTRPPRRSAEEVKPNKRSQYAKRYAFMDEVSRQVKTLLTPFPR